jgi:hypothetical protein
MQRALKEPCVLLEGLCFQPDVAPGDALGAWLSARAEAQLPPPERLISGAWCWLVSSWEEGGAALEGRARAVLDPAWRGVGACLAGQPEVYVLACRGLAWPAEGDSPRALCVLTRDVLEDPARRGRRPPMPERGELPSVEGAWVWPVLGHQGRILVLCEAARAEGIFAEAARQWGPLADPPVTRAL